MEHHAFVLFDTVPNGLSVLPETIRTPSVDVVHFYGERMTIDEVRTLIYEANLMPFSESIRTFVLGYRTILPEAQHALLKLLEEPPHTARFYVIVNHESNLLSTLRSRLMGYPRTEPTTSSPQSTAFESFQTQSYAQRTTEIGKRLAAEDMTWVEDMMQGFESYAARAQDPALIADVLMTRTYLPFPGSSKKMLLEHLALSLPL